MKITLSEYYKGYHMRAVNVWTDDINSIEHARQYLERAAYLLWRHQEGYIEDYWATDTLFVVDYKDRVCSFIIE